MADVVESILQWLITSALGGASQSARVLALAAQGALIALLTYIFVLRPVLQLIRDVDPRSVKPMSILWALLVVYSVVALRFGFEVWPATVFVIGFSRALTGRSLGVLGRIPSLRRLPLYSEALRTVYVAHYPDLRRSREPGFWGSMMADMRFRQAREGTLIAVVLDSAMSGLGLSAIVGLVVQPIGTLLSGGSGGSVPRDVFVSIGTSMVSIFAVVGYGVQAMLIAVGERSVELATPSDDEVERARLHVARHEKELRFSGWTLVWRLTSLLLLGGLAGGLALSQR